MMDSMLDEYRKAFASLGRVVGYKLVEVHKPSPTGSYLLEYDCESSDQRLANATVIFVQPDGFQAAFMASGKDLLTTYHDIFAQLPGSSFLFPAKQDDKATGIVKYFWREVKIPKDISTPSMLMLWLSATYGV